MDGITLDGHIRLLIPFFLVPAPAYDPLARFEVGSGRSDPFHDCGPTFLVAKIELLERTADPGEMTMSLNESRDDHSSCEIDDPGPGSPERENRIGCTQFQDLAVCDGEGLNPGLFVVHRDDFAVEQDQFDVLRRRRAAQAPRENCQSHDEDRKQDSSHWRFS